MSACRLFHSGVTLNFPLPGLPFTSKAALLIGLLISAIQAVLILLIVLIAQRAAYVFLISVFHLCLPLSVIPQGKKQ
jgi:hypothetical protein